MIVEQKPNITSTIECIKLEPEEPCCAICQHWRWQKYTGYCALDNQSVRDAKQCTHYKEKGTV